MNGVVIPEPNHDDDGGAGMTPHGVPASVAVGVLHA